MEEKFLYGNQEKNKLGLIPDAPKYDYDEEFFLNMAMNETNSSYYQIIKQIKDNSSVLDIGCANGLLGFLIKKLKGSKVDGIEYDKELYELAKKKSNLDNVYNLSILDDKDKIKNKLSNKKYDYIIFGDVLEHLDEPWQALINVYDLLNDDGKIIVSLPNICNFDIIKALINEEFNYGHLGILDTTHVKFFTSSSFVEMIENLSTQYNIKYDVEKTGEVNFILPYNIDDSFANLFKEGNALSKKYNIMQNIFVLKKSKQKNIKIKGIDNQKDNYKEIVSQIEKLEKEIVRLNDENENLRKEYNILSTDYQSIVNSKGWKMLDRIYKLKNRK